MQHFLFLLDSFGSADRVSHSLRVAVRSERVFCPTVRKYDFFRIFARNRGRIAKKHRKNALLIRKNNKNNKYNQ